ncbi:MAG: type I-C CRISPR-associated protein Cas5 [Ruminiclostridium sp.]|nr:type I-C CRISPR-associated protein Cas5 [Ruminiclostridium sp.]MBQ5317796.1 type I-C CRISPR-associated protein Cas5 [Oscillospiraceae bacterium]
MFIEKELIKLSKPKHENSVEFVVYGDHALFSDILTRPGSEKTSYRIPTFEALKGILHSIYWKPTIVWYVDSVRVMKKISTERKGIRPIGYSGGNDLCYYTYLTDVEYQVKAHFEWNDNRPELMQDRNENKHHNIAKRMIKAGGRRDVFLGTRECVAYVEPCVFGEGEGAFDNTGELPFGLMLHGITYADEAVLPEDKGLLTVRLWNPVMKDGVIEFIRPEECTIKRHIRSMEIKPFGKEHKNFTGLEEFVGGDEFELD